MLYRGKHVSHRRLRTAASLVMLFLVAALLIYPWVEPMLLQVDSRSIAIASLPAGVGQLRIVYLTDIHESGWPFFTHGAVRDLVRRVNSLNPDIVLLGGDYAVDSDSAIAFFQDLPRINSNYGVYGVMGNHDRTVPESNLSRLRAAMFAAGVTPLVNETASIRIGTSDIYLAGLDDVDNGWPDLQGLARQVKQEDFVIFLSHSPAVIPNALTATDASGHKSWFDLGLFGHTHGGQIALLGQLLGISKVNPRYEHGWIVENKINMLISNGVGTSVLPLRFLRPPQIHLITVRRGS